MIWILGGLGILVAIDSWLWLFVHGYGPTIIEPPAPPRQIVSPLDTGTATRL